MKYIFLLIGIAKGLKAQEKLAIGLSAAYNLPLNGVGVGLRAQIPFASRLLAVPQARYYPGFNKIHELNVGANVHLLLLPPKKTQGRGRSLNPNIYLTAGGMYTRWINYFNSANSRAKRNNFIPDIGAGAVIGSSAFQGFIEGKYNILWKESYVEVGVLVSPAILKANNSRSCPAYD